MKAGLNHSPNDTSKYRRKTDLSSSGRGKKEIVVKL